MAKKKKVKIGKVQSKRGKSKGNIQRKKRLLVIYMMVFTFFLSTFIYLWYHGNKPIFKQNVIEDSFEDQIVGIFPAGWFSIVNPWNVKVVSDGTNNVMEVKGISAQGYTEIQKKFKRTAEGIIKCKVKILDMNTRFVIHIAQRDREYNPNNDIIITFLEGGIYVVGEANLIESENGLSLWENLIMVNDDMSWAIDEQSLLDSNSIMNYILNSWYSIEINFNQEEFFLTINENFLGVFDYPKYDSIYFTSIYFIPFMTKYDFKFYVDDVEITISNPVDYIHPLNIFILVLMIFLLSMIILCYFKFSKLKRKTTTKRGK